MIDTGSCQSHGPSVVDNWYKYLSVVLFQTIHLKNIREKLWQCPSTVTGYIRTQKFKRMLRLIFSKQIKGKQIRNWRFVYKYLDIVEAHLSSTDEAKQQFVCRHEQRMDKSEQSLVSVTHFVFMIIKIHVVTWVITTRLVGYLS